MYVETKTIKINVPECGDKVCYCYDGAMGTIVKKPQYNHHGHLTDIEVLYEDGDRVNYDYDTDLKWNEQEKRWDVL